MLFSRSAPHLSGSMGRAAPAPWPLNATSTSDKRRGATLGCELERARPGPTAVARLGLEPIGDSPRSSRDDLDDGGPASFVACIQQVRARSPGTYIELLVPRVFLRQLGTPLCRVECGRVRMCSTTNRDGAPAYRPRCEPPQGNLRTLPGNCCNGCAKAGPRAYTKSG